MPFLSWIRIAKRSLIRLSWTTILTVVGSFLIGVLFLSVIIPLVLRYLILPPVVSYRQQLDFTFHTCDEQLSGVCSYLEATFDLKEEGLSLSPNYYYTFKLTMELFESFQNNQNGVFQAQVTPKAAGGIVLDSFKKLVLLRQSFYTNVYRFVRNTCFFPLYIIGYFTQSDSTIDVEFSHNLLEKSSQPTEFISVQLQNKYVQVADAYLELNAHVGLFGYLVSKFPILSYLASVGFCFTINMTLFVVYWGNKGIKVFTSNDFHAFAENDIDRILTIPKKTAFDRVESSKNLKSLTPKQSPSDLALPSAISSASPESGFNEKIPESLIYGEVPENISFDEFYIPGWGPEPDNVDVVVNNIVNSATQETIETLTTDLQNDFQKCHDESSNEVS